MNVKILFNWNKIKQVVTEPEEDIYEDPDVNFPKLHAVKGQIQLMEADILVNAANKELRPGGIEYTGDYFNWFQVMEWIKPLELPVDPKSPKPLRKSLNICISRFSSQDKLFQRTLIN